MVEAYRLQQGPAHFTRPPVACRFARIVWVPSYAKLRQHRVELYVSLFTARGYTRDTPAAEAFKGAVQRGLAGRRTFLSFRTHEGGTVGEFWALVQSMCVV